MSVSRYAVVTLTPYLPEISIVSFVSGLFNITFYLDFVNHLVF